MRVILEARRYGVVQKEPYDNLEDALYSAYWMIEDGRAAPRRILGPDRRVWLEGEGLDAALRDKGAEIEAVYLRLHGSDR